MAASDMWQEYAKVQFLSKHLIERVLLLARSATALRALGVERERGSFFEKPIPSPAWAGGTACNVVSDTNGLEPTITNFALQVAVVLVLVLRTLMQSAARLGSWDVISDLARMGPMAY